MKFPGSKLNRAIGTPVINDPVINNIIQQLSKEMWPTSLLSYVPPSPPLLFYLNYLFNVNILFLPTRIITEINYLNLSDIYLGNTNLTTRSFHKLTKLESLGTSRNDWFHSLPVIHIYIYIYRSKNNIDFCQFTLLAIYKNEKEKKIRIKSLDDSFHNLFSKK